MSKPNEPHAESAAIAHLGALVGPPIRDEIWIGDDAAVLALAHCQTLFATDISVEGVHFDRQIGSLADVGWRALVQNLSDIAAMGGSPHAAVVAVAGATAIELSSIYDGLLAASRQFGCPVVGGDLSDGPALVVSIAILGEPGSRGPVLRSNPRPGDAIFVTGHLGGAAAGLRLLRVDPGSVGPLVDAFLRPSPRLEEGAVAGSYGASAMIDVSDGFGIDLHRVADASGIGFVLDDLPVAAGATEEEAIAGGEDYELVFCSSDPEEVIARFIDAGLREPTGVGHVIADREVRTLRDAPLTAEGFEHRLGGG